MITNKALFTLLIHYARNFQPNKASADVLVRENSQNSADSARLVQLEFDSIEAQFYFHDDVRGQH
jgi:hypothetical protein